MSELFSAAPLFANNITPKRGRAASAPRTKARVTLLYDDNVRDLSVCAVVFEPVVASGSNSARDAKGCGWEMSHALPEGSRADNRLRPGPGPVVAPQSTPEAQHRQYSCPL